MLTFAHKARLLEVLESLGGAPADIYRADALMRYSPIVIGSGLSRDFAEALVAQLEVCGFEGAQVVHERSFIGFARSIMASSLALLHPFIAVMYLLIAGSVVVAVQATGFFAKFFAVQSVFLVMLLLTAQLFITWKPAIAEWS